jgi:hypothetical protein
LRFLTLHDLLFGIIEFPCRLKTPARNHDKINGFDLDLRDLLENEMARFPPRIILSGAAYAASTERRVTPCCLRGRRCSSDVAWWMLLLFALFKCGRAAPHRDDTAHRGATTRMNSEWR